MSKTTPPPWTWNEDRPEKYDLEWLRGPNGERLIDIYGNGKMTPDKRLIAKSPELLEVCRSFTEELPKTAIEFYAWFAERTAKARSLIAAIEQE